jgi:hypothetical protein
MYESIPLSKTAEFLRGVRRVHPPITEQVGTLGGVRTTQQHRYTETIARDSRHDRNLDVSALIRLHEVGARRFVPGDAEFTSTKRAPGFRYADASRAATSVWPAVTAEKITPQRAVRSFMDEQASTPTAAA